MPNAPNQTVPLNLTRRIRCQTRDNTTGQPTTEPLTVGGFSSSIITVAIDGADDRVVVITPVASGNTTLTINKTPSGSDPLLVNVTVTGNANIGSVQFVEVVTPDIPK
jgi:hypothetical protein